jgi:hypothetical protein
MTSSSSSGSIEAVERIINRGGDADEVVRAVVGALHKRFAYVAIRFVDGDDIAAGDRTEALTAPVEFQGSRVAELALATDDEALVRRLATIISPYCRFASREG